MTRHYTRAVDGNQAQIVAALNRCGARVQLLHRVGQGCPDLLVGWRGQLVLIEVKMPGKHCTEDEAEWQQLWAGYPVFVCDSFEDCAEALEKITGQKFGRSLETWGRWWADHRERALRARGGEAGESSLRTTPMA